MEIISFLNNQFWGDSGYMILLTLSLIMILWNKKNNVRAKTVAIYSVLVLVLIIYNPLAAPIGLHFFSEDSWAYLRIFYLLPLMPLIAYAATDYYADAVDAAESVGKKLKYLAVICMIIVVSGCTFDESLYVRAENPYKIDQQALDISEMILSDSGGKTRAVMPEDDVIVYGIRQYTADIVVAARTDGIDGEAALAELESGYDFQYIVLGKDKETLRMLEKHSYECIGSTEDYYVVGKAED